jgi:hypothetical protein
MAAISKSAAEALVKAMREEGVRGILTGWAHAVRGHYNFKNPSQPEDPTKSYFTIGGGVSGIEQSNIMVGLLGKVIGTQNSPPDMRGDDADNSKVYIYRTFPDVIGKSSLGRDCYIVRIILSSQTSGPSRGKPIMKTTYPDTSIVGTALR